MNDLKWKLYPKHKPTQGYGVYPIMNSVEVKNTFEPVDVLVSYVTEPRGDYYGKCEMLYFTDLLNGKTILVVGTENLDDYYPSFVASWMPENMAVNEVKK